MVSDQWVLTLSKDGRILSRLNTRDLGIHEPISDIASIDSEDLYLGLQRSQEIWRVGANGKFKEKFPREPSSFVTDTRVFGMVRDPARGVLYFADTVHHTLEIYDHNQQLVKKLRAPETVDPYQQRRGTESFTYLLGMAFYENRLYVADTDNLRIVVLYPDGSLDRAFKAVTEETDRYIYPRRVSRTRNLLFFVNRGPRLEGGQVVRLELDTEEYSLVQEPFPMDPVDVLGADDELLVVDSESLAVHRYTLDGAYLGLFGSQELQNFYAGTKIQQKTYEWLRFISLGIVIVMLAGLVALNRQQKRPQQVQSPSPLKTALADMSTIKRRLLIGVVPGLGYWASSRYIEFMAVALSVLFVIVIAYFELATGGSERSVFSGTLYAAITMLIGLIVLIWTFTTVHATGLVEMSADKSRSTTKELLSKFIGFPVLSLVAVFLAQGASEMVLLAVPALSKTGAAIGISMSETFDVLTGKAPSEVGYLARIYPTDNIIRQALGWGMGMGVMFWALARYSVVTKYRPGIYAVMGTVLGALVWIGTRGFFGNILGSGFILPLAQGLSTGVITYLVFRKQLSALSITAVMSGAWLGSTIYIMLLGSGYGLPFPRPLMGFSARASGTACAFFFMVMGILYVQHVLSVTPGENKSSCD